MSLLVRSAQAGDELAFAELVRSHQDRAVAYATAILGDYHLAEDAAQEAFVDAYRELRSLSARSVRAVPASQNENARAAGRERDASEAVDSSAAL